MDSKQFIYELAATGIRCHITLIPDMRIYKTGVSAAYAGHCISVLNEIGRLCPDRKPTEIWNFVTGENQTD